MVLNFNIALYIIGGLLPFQSSFLILYIKNRSAIIVKYESVFKALKLAITYECRKLLAVHRTLTIL